MQGTYGEVGKRVEEISDALLIVTHESLGHETSQNKNGEALTTEAARLGSLQGKAYKRKDVYQEALLRPFGVVERLLG